MVIPSEICSSTWMDGLLLFGCDALPPNCGMFNKYGCRINSSHTTCGPPEVGTEYLCGALLPETYREKKLYELFAAGGLT
jgi:hypothetical protein